MIVDAQYLFAEAPEIDEPLNRSENRVDSFSHLVKEVFAALTRPLRQIYHPKHILHVEKETENRNSALIRQMERQSQELPRQESDQYSEQDWTKDKLEPSGTYAPAWLTFV